ncbi:MAG: helix-turn-helix domain-containing protein [Anaerolineae bacterium]|nr:helix-turn-helix domain-containing protein [Anaerolineae bacterium]
MIDSDDVMTVKEVSHFLKLTEATIYRLAQEGKLPGRKIGGAWRFSRRHLTEWVASPAPSEPPRATPTANTPDEEPLLHL